MDQSESRALLQLAERDLWSVDVLPVGGVDIDILRRLDALGLIEARTGRMDNQQKYPRDPTPPKPAYSPWFSPINQPHIAGGWDSIMATRTDRPPSEIRISERGKAEVARLKEIGALPERKSVDGITSSTTLAKGSSDELLCYLADQPDKMSALIELPKKLLNADMLTVCDADKLIEFGTRNHIGKGPKQEIVVENGWIFRSITGPNCKPMDQFLAEAFSFTGDERIRPHIRLTAEGRVRAARLRVDRPTEKKTATPSSMDRQEVRRRLLEICDAGERYTSLRDLQKRTGCGSTSTVRNAIKESETLREWRDQAKPHNRRLRASSLTDAVIDSTAQTNESDPSNVLTDEEIDHEMRRLIEQAKPEEKAKLNGLDDAGRRRLVQALLEHKGDREPSPIQDDQPLAPPHKVVEHKRV